MHHYLMNPTKLQLEISSMCNALCYGCARTESANFNTKRPLIPDKKILTAEIEHAVRFNGIEDGIDGLDGIVGVGLSLEAITN